MKYKAIFFLLLAVITLPGFSQKNKASQLYTPGNQTFVLSMNGQALLVNKYANLVDGTPYLIDSWREAKLRVAENHPYIPLSVKVNLLENNLLFKDSLGREMVTSSKVRELVLPDPTYGDMTYTQIDALTDQPASGTNVWVQVLAKGKAQLYKYIRKQLVETRPYGSSSVEQRITSQDFYYIQVDEKVIRIKKVKDILEPLGEKKEALTLFVNSTKLPEKSPVSFQQVIEYYNQLFK